MADEPGTQVTRDALEQYHPDGGLGRRLIALPEHRCIYVKNMKAGCSTVSLWLHRIHTGDRGFVPETRRHQEFMTPRPWKVGWDRVARMLDGEAFRFTFVRDPVTRAQSAYQDLVVRLEDDTYRTLVRRTLGLPEAPGEEVTLDHFVAALEAQEPMRMDVHWRPQHLNLMHPVVSYDFIGKLENFDADLARVREAVGLPDVPYEVRNRSERPVGSVSEGHPDLLRRIRDVYARDFELYGY